MAYTVEDINDYQNRLDAYEAEVLIEHCNTFGIHPTITAWYDDKKDFYQDWVYDNEIFETEEDAEIRFLYGRETGEFYRFESGEIVRLAY